MSDIYYNKQPSPSYPQNQYLSDKTLQFYLKILLPKEELSRIEEELIQLGHKCGSVYPELAREAELYKPILERYDAFGNIINKIYTSGAWKTLSNECCKEMLASYSYINKNRNSKFSRLIQMTKVYLMSHISGMTSCPISMTDSASYLIDYIRVSSSQYINEEINESYKRLISNDIEYFITSGQWMTEILGGSDVRSSTQTVAIKLNELNDETTNKYKLYGMKWFTSAIDASITFTLAKIKEKNGEIDSSPTLFFMKIRHNNILNHIDIVRLKDKLGTRQLPTAEIILNGSIADMASPRGQGIPYIMKMGNVSRLHNMCASVSYMRGMISLIEDYSLKRKVFNKQLNEQRQHLSSLFSMTSLHEGCLLLCLFCSQVFGEDYILKGKSQHGQLLRMLLPLGKILCGRLSEEVCLDGIQSFGAIGYMENSGIPSILRDTIVTSIWEGTINTLSIEFFKNFNKSKQILTTFIKSCFEFMNENNDLHKEVLLLLIELDQIPKVDNLNEGFLREACFFISSLIVIGLLYKYNQKNYDDKKHVIEYWMYIANCYLRKYRMIKKGYIYSIKF